MRPGRGILLPLLLLVLPSGLRGQEAGGASLPFEIEGLFYLSWLSGEVGGEDRNAFSVTRSYLTVRTRPLEKLEGRITLDSTQDREGDGRGDMKVRLKYAYAKYHFGDVGPVRGLGLEGGIVHMVWLDFEEHVNLYRMRDPMFMERSGLFNSADFGLTLSGDLGESLGEAYTGTVTSSYAARFGSFALGVYNGGGYHADERNTNKVVEGRLTLRPLPDRLPGLQLSGLAIVGEGNREEDAFDAPDWRTYAGFLSYQHARATLTAQYAWGRGNQGGSWTEPPGGGMPGEATDFDGYSFFAEARPGGGWRLIAGRDRFERTPVLGDESFDRVHAGVGYDLGDRNVLVLDWDRRQWDDGERPTDTRYRVVMQLRF